MQRQIIIPVPELKPYIQYYILLDIKISNDNTGVLCTFPTGCCIMIIFYSFDLPVFIFPNEEVGNLRSFVSGYLHQGVRLHASGHFKCIITQFTESGVYHLFGIPPSKYVNTFVSLEDLIGKEGKKIEDIMNVTQKTDQMADQLDRFFLNILHRKQKVDFTRCEHIQNSIINHQGNIRIGDIIDEFNVSQRQLDRDFKKLLGISPKEYAWLVRLNTAYNLLLFEKDRSIADITYSLGYFDQAHMLKDFSKYSDFTPGDLRKSTNKVLLQNLLVARFQT